MVRCGGRLVGGLALALLGVAAGGCLLAAPAAPPVGHAALIDTGLLTSYPLPPNHRPWELAWDAPRGRLWFTEDYRGTPALDQIASLDPTTNVLREWTVPTQGSYVHALALDRSGNVWFTEIRGPIGRVQPATNTVTEWTLPGMAGPHGIVVDDSDAAHVVVWITEHDVGMVTSFAPASGQFRRHPDPIPAAQPHGVALGADGSLWFVETCANRVGRLIAGVADQWTFWQPPTPMQCGAPNIGPLAGFLLAGDFWYTEPTNANLLRLQGATNTFTIWPGPGPGVAQLTQAGADPAGDIFFTEMRANKIGRLEPAGATTPTVVSGAPLTWSQPTPAAAQATAVSAVWTPNVVQVGPTQQALAGLRAGGIVEWTLPPALTPGPGYVGPLRAAYGGDAFWAAAASANQILRFAPDSPTPLPTATWTPQPTATARPPSSTPTLAPPTATRAAPTATAPAPATVTAAPATATPCPSHFADVRPTDYFYTPVLSLACRGVLSGYADGTFRPYAPTIRAQMVKIVVLGFGLALRTPPAGGPTFADVPPGAPFFAVIETAAAGGLVSGYACGGPGEPCDPALRPYFRPYAAVTRGQLAKIVATGAAWPLLDPPAGTFADVAPGSAFYRYVEAAVCHGVISGYACGGPGEPCDPAGRPYFRPGTGAIRGQIAKIVYAALTSPAPCPPPGAAALRK